MSELSIYVYRHGLYTKYLHPILTAPNCKTIRLLGVMSREKNIKKKYIKKTFLTLPQRGEMYYIFNPLKRTVSR